MKKLLFFLLCFIIIINSALFAYEDDNFKVNDKDWEAEKKSSKSTVFFLNKSISVIAEDTGEEVTRSDLRPYVIVRVSEYSDLNVADFSQKGLEEFKKTVIRNMLIKIVSLACIFLLIKSPNDLKLYFVIYVLSNVLGNLSLWFYLPKFISKVKLKKLNIFHHFKPTIALFIPQIAIQV
ncbi:MAG: hypothetical protein J6Z11_03180, partial [Candidatus Riflebacteria bacterium]|nr:hypothetical protein [Candidatus Riflebacteria bacterium]